MYIPISLPLDACHSIVCSEHNSVVLFVHLAPCRSNEPPTPYSRQFSEWPNNVFPY